LLDAASFISTLQRRQGLRLSCPEEIAYGQKWITTEQLLKLATPLTKNGCGKYLMGLVK
jgi:glucose-1-phosphate thymidylyltransferase